MNLYRWHWDRYGRLWKAIKQIERNSFFVVNTEGKALYLTLERIKDWKMTPTNYTDVDIESGQLFIYGH
jgi:hypothetical protein